MFRKIKILEAKFTTSAPNIRSAPEPAAPEAVFLGRSNVGKSSLLNALCARKNLAKTSAAPGKTRLINFYDICFEFNGRKGSIRFVDLPGFGYAKISREERADWENDLAGFLKKRETIKLFLRLIDSRHTDLPQDKILLDFTRQIIKSDQKELAVFTKSDKLNRKERDALLRKYNNAALVSINDHIEIENLLETIIQTSFENENGNEDGTL